MRPQVFTELTRRSCSSGGEGALRVALAEEVSDAGVGGGQRLFVGKEDDAEVLGTRLLAESGAVHDHDVFLKNQFFYEDFVAFGNVDFGEGVESAARRNATHTRSRVCPLHRHVTPRAQLAADFDEMILRAVERSLD